MPRVCTVCSSPDRAAIDEALTRGEPNRRIAARVGCGEASIRRHAAHLSETVALATRAAEETRADDLLGLLREAVADARRLRVKAEAQDDVRGAIAAVKVLCDVVEKLADVGERLAAAESAKPSARDEAASLDQLSAMVAGFLTAGEERADA